MLPQFQWIHNLTHIQRTNRPVPGPFAPHEHRATEPAESPADFAPDYQQEYTNLKGLGVMSSPKTVVCIEVQPQQEEHIDTFLAQYGFEIIRAAHAERTVDLVQQEPPDVLLLDMSAEQEIVWSMFHRLRHSMRTCNVPIILITPRSTTIEHVRQLYAANAAGYLTKPYTPHELLESIDRALTS